MSDFVYVGTELELFAHARNWKAYWRSQVAPYLSGEILEVGAGIGTNTTLLRGTTSGSWICLEPDPSLAGRLQQSLDAAGDRSRYRLVVGTLADLDPTAQFDAILYIDVLEHIADDEHELVQAMAHLRPGGTLIVLAPAHQWLFTPFDEAIGHHRRYSKRTLAAAGPGGLRLERLGYLDAAGLLASTANRLLLNRRMPTPQQIHFWDSWLVPCSVRLDRWLRHAVGKSVLAVWRRPHAAGS
jgi:SAM-dependent methyltransferase